MKTNELMSNSEFCNVAKEQALFKSSVRLQIYLSSLFADIDLRGKRVIDIGGGTGLYSFYAAACGGARNVVCLEPEVHGRHSGMNVKFF